MRVSPRTFRGQATQRTAAPVESCFAVLAEVDGYPDWCPDVVQAVEVLERDVRARPTRVRLAMHVPAGSLSRNFDLFLAIATDSPWSVTLTRFTDHPTNQAFTATWALRPENGTRIELALDAKLRIPRHIPTGRVADVIAGRFVESVCRRLDAASTQMGTASGPRPALTDPRDDAGIGA